MICQRCNKNNSTVHLTKIVNGKKTELYLCEDCARETGHLSFPENDPFDFTNLLKGILSPETDIYGDYFQEDRCSLCGMTYRDFTKNALLGCSNCYIEFENRLEPILRRIHGNIIHNGKVPRRTGGSLRIRKEIEEYKEEMQRAVDNEEFEKAAELRDKIRELEKLLGGKGGDGDAE
ncbi:MAG: UvrB/UvrC motif-containing protein [Halanaerobiales bacterium]